MARRPGVFSRRIAVALSVLAFGGAACGVSARRGDAPDRRVGAEDGRPIVVTLPCTTGRDLESALLRAAAGAGVPVGIERLEGAPAERITVHGTYMQRRVTLTDRSLRDAWAVLLNPDDAGTPSMPAGPAYRVAWPEGSDMAHVSGGEGATFLDRIVPDFTVEHATLEQATATLVRELDPAFGTVAAYAGWVGGRGPADGASGASAVERLDAPVSLSVRGGTVRTALDHLAEAHGRVSWVVRYTSPQGDYAGSQIVFAAFNGRTETIRAR